MAENGVTQWSGDLVTVTLTDDTCIQGTILTLVPHGYISLVNAINLNTQQPIYGTCNIPSNHIKDLKVIPIPKSGTQAPPPPPTQQPDSQQSQSSGSGFQDPAIISLGRRPGLGSRRGTDKGTAPSAVTRTERHIVTNPADHLTYSSPDETDTTTTAAVTGSISALKISPPDPSRLDTTEDDSTEQTPTATQGQQHAKAKRNRKPNRQKGPSSNVNTDGLASPFAPGANQGTGWRQTPILESTKSFQPFNSLKKGRKGGKNGSSNNVWASEDVTDVQEAGDFDFESSLAKFDKRTIFNEMREQDQVDESERLVSHNRLPRPKPGTSGGKNLHYTENVLDLPPTTGPKLKETPDDFWKSEADDAQLRDGDHLSSREGSGRNSRLRGDSRMSTSRRSQSRKASGSAAVNGPGRVSTGFSSSPVPSGLYTVSTHRRVETVTYLQMLNVENVAQNTFELTEELMAENAGRSVAEVALLALRDPAITLLAAAASPPQSPNLVVLAGNHKSGIRAIAAARHLRNKGINVFICVVGIEREKELLDDIRKQIRLFRKLGGTVCSKSELFDQLSKPAATLSSSTQISVTLIVDALLGLSSPFEELLKSDQATTYELMQWANQNEAFVMAVDIPSGIDPTNGKINVIDGAKLCVHPRYVVALGAPKQGLLKALEMGDEQSEALMVDEWKLYLADIGLGLLIWRKAATKIRRGIDFDDKFVLEMQYQGPLQPIA